MLTSHCIISIFNVRTSLQSVDVTLGKHAGDKFWFLVDKVVRKLKTTYHLHCTLQYSQYYFNVLPYGISSRSEKFQKCMSRFIKGLEELMSAMLMTCSSMAPLKSNSRLKVVLESLSRCYAKHTVHKCTFSVTKFLEPPCKSHSTMHGGHSQKVAVMVNLPTPKTICEFCVFLGMVNYMPGQVRRASS